MFRISIARVVALISPVVATLAATAATWLTVHVHLFATFHIGANAIAQAIAQAVVFGVTAIGTYLIQHKVLDGAVQVVAAERAAAVRRVP